jgi:hypothetical protein
MTQSSAAESISPDGLGYLSQLSSDSHDFLHSRGYAVLKPSWKVLLHADFRLAMRAPSTGSYAPARITLAVLVTPGHSASSKKAPLRGRNQLG